MCVCVCYVQLDGVALEVGSGERNKPGFTKYDGPVTNRSKDSYLAIIYQWDSYGGNFSLMIDKMPFFFLISHGSYGHFSQG